MPICRLSAASTSCKPWMTISAPCSRNASTPLFHHFLKLLIADRIGHIPADTPKDHLTLKMAALRAVRRIRFQQQYAKPLPSKVCDSPLFPLGNELRWKSNADAVNDGQVSTEETIFLFIHD